MAVLTAQGISQLVLELLVRSLVLPRTVAPAAGTEFAGPNGATITVRVRQPREPKIQETPGAPIDYTNVAEVGVDVTLTHLYDATRLTDEDLTLGIENFGAQVSAPQVAAVAIGAENIVAAAMNDLDNDLIIDVDGSDIEDKVLEAREELGDNEVPLGNRWLAVSPAVATMMLKLDKFSRVDASGTASALRDAVLGRIYGFNVVESAALHAGTAIAYHESGFVFANRAPVIPQGATDAAVTNQDGIAVRQLFAFDPGILSDVSAVSTFAGASVVTEAGDERKRAVKLGLLGSN